MPGNFKIHLLDVGSEKYGDCLLCERDGKWILIDGGHPKNIDNMDGHPSIPEQIAEITSQDKPKIDLLVVTHCHNDHIGCLPELFGEHLLYPKWALVADEQLGFGRPGDDSAADAERSLPFHQRAVVAAMREEDASYIKSDAQLREFLADAARLEDRYKSLLKRLKQNSTKIYRYRGETPEELLSAFKGFGLEILGPTEEQLLLCADAISKLNQDVLEALSDFGPDATGDEVALYRTLATSGLSDAADRPGKGAALNDQSIVIKLKVDDKSALLLGDMQLAKAEVKGVDIPMSALVAALKEAGPYDFVKLAHHSSYNGLNEEVFAAFGGAPLLAHSGGTDDPSHPDATALKLLKSKARSISLARTDRNGLITANLMKQTFEITKGRLNDFTPNTDAPVSTAISPEIPAAPIAPPSSPTQVSNVSEVSVTIPLKITVRLEVPGFDAITVAPVHPRDSHANEPAFAFPILSLEDGRFNARLLFVTNAVKLAENIGQGEADHVIRAIKASRHKLITDADPADAIRATTTVRSQLSSIDGVVLLGGYDVVPPILFDVLSPSVRKKITSTNDADEFYVWSDEPYGCKDGDNIGELPVSRVPDGKSSKLVFTSLQVSGWSGNTPTVERFGIRNSRRPFADPIFKTAIPGTTKMLASQPTSYRQLSLPTSPVSSWYLMLHGSDNDALMFWGEDDTGYTDAFHVSNIPLKVAGVVFTGCCWGALLGENTANECRDGRKVGARTAHQSIALTFLSAGTQAFIGCTGSHYSPTKSPYRYFGGPMHEAFWSEMRKGEPPARALFNARGTYARDIPHNRTDPEEMAIEYKIWRQFTCLGLGW